MEEQNQTNSKIQLRFSDWMFNASIIGFMNIVGNRNVKQIQSDTIEFDIELLENFETKYFNYFIETYKENLSWYRIVSFEEKVRHYLETDFNDFDLNKLKTLNKYVRDTAKCYLKSASYKSAYPLFALDSNPLELEKKLKTIKEPKSEIIFNEKRVEIINEVKENLQVIQAVIDFCKKEESKKYLAGANVIYTIIRNGWDGISFLNPQTKEKDPYKNYETYFLQPVREMLSKTNEKNKYHCFSCNSPMASMDNDLSFLRATGFDTNRKPSHVWNFVNDIAICPICKLIYSCLPAGIAYLGKKGIFVNSNFDISVCYNINHTIKGNILNHAENQGNNSVYAAFVKAFQEMNQGTYKYELSDIQVVRFQDEQYSFNLISRKTQYLIKECEAAGFFKYLHKASLKEGNAYIYLYDVVLGHIVNNQNLTLFIHTLLYSKIAQPSNCFYRMGVVRNIIEINRRFIQGIGGTNMSEKTIKDASAVGYYLREKYKAKGSDNKIPGISYRLLNALKTNNSSMFMDVVLNCYLYVKDQVPKILVTALEEQNFQTIGYAFVAGLIDGENKVRKEDK